MSIRPWYDVPQGTGSCLIREESWAVNSSHGWKLEAGMEKKPQEVSSSQATSCCISGLQNRWVEPLLLGRQPSVCKTPLEDSLEMFACRHPVLTDSRSMVW